jgi:hypothetical protein
MDAGTAKAILPRVLTWWNVITFVVLAALLAATFWLKLDGSEGSFLDVATAALTWLWLATTPIVAGTAHFFCRRTSWRRGVRLNQIVLGLWAITVVGALTIH